jgi:chromate transporter
VAHLAIFRREFVLSRHWLDDARYTDWVALCQFLPGPASSQMGMALGWLRAGWAGALAAWLGFTLPSAVLMAAAALGLAELGRLPAGALTGLLWVAWVVVAQAIWQMGQRFCRGATRLALALGTAAVTAAWATPWAMLGAMALAAAAGLWTLPPPKIAPLGAGRGLPRSAKHWALAALALHGALLLALPWAATQSPWLALADAYYRVGAWVLGGGHVVLPLLQAEVVQRGWVDAPTFMAGYGLAQALPGPLFAFAAFLGAAGTGPANGWTGAAVATVGIFLPGFLLVLGMLPFWEQLRSRPSLQAAMNGVQASVVGLLLAALWQALQAHPPALADGLGLAGVAALLLRARWPVWVVVPLAAALGVALHSALR